MNLIAYVLTKLRTPKDLVRQMSRKSRFRRAYDKQHGKRSKTLLKSCTTAPLSSLLTNMKEIELEKVSLSDM